jgi:hypothetical protein
MLDAERQLVDALEENANDSSRADLKKAFEQETEGQLKRQYCRSNHTFFSPERQMANFSSHPATLVSSDGL